MSNLTIDINGYCNERCAFCYQRLDGSFLPTDLILRIVDAQQGVERVQIGGGEPLLDPRIADLTRAMREKGKMVHISTNATVLPSDLLALEDKVRDGVQMQVSIHGSNREVYKMVHGRDLFDTVVRNTRKLKERFSTVMTSAVYQDNFDDVPGLVQLAKNFGIPLRVNLVFPVGNGRAVNILTPRQVDQLRGYLLQERILQGEMIDSPIVHGNNCYALQDAYGIKREGACPLDCDKRYVSPRNEVSGCEFYFKPGTSGDKNGR